MNAKNPARLAQKPEAQSVAGSKIGVYSPVYPVCYPARAEQLASSSSNQSMSQGVNGVKVVEIKGVGGTEGKPTTMYQGHGTLPVPPGAVYMQGQVPLHPSHAALRQQPVYAMNSQMQPVQFSCPPQRHRGHQNQPFYPSYQPTIVAPNLFGSARGPTTQHAGFYHAPLGPNGDAQNSANSNASRRRQSRGKAILDLVDPKTGKSINEEIYDEDNATPTSDSDNRATPEPQACSMIVIADFAACVGKAATDDAKSSSPAQISPPETPTSQNPSQTIPNLKIHTNAEIDNHSHQFRQDHSFVCLDHHNSKPNGDTTRENIDKRVQEPMSKNEQANEINLKTPLLLKYSYTDGQWSPLNRSGKKVYNRDFLIKLRSDPNSKIKPLNLPDLEIVLEDISSKNTRQVPQIKPISIIKSQKEKPSQSTRRAVINESLSISITKKDEKEIAWRPKQELIEEANCNLVKNQPDSSVDKSKVQYGIKFQSIFLDRNSCFSNSSGQLSMEQIHMLLLCIISDEKTNSYNNIWSWISANVGASASKLQFIKVLMTAILETSIEPCDYTWKFREYKLLELQELISRYISVNLDCDLLELQCLIAIQEYIHKLEHPSGVLLKIIETLYDYGIVSTEAFLAWESNKDPTAQVGKSRAMLDLKSFFTSLKESDYESSDEDEGDLSD